MNKFKCPQCGNEDDAKLVAHVFTGGDEEQITIACKECGHIWKFIPEEIKKTWSKYEYWRISASYEWLKSLMINSNPCAMDKAYLEESEIIDIVPDEIRRMFNIIFFMPRDNKVGYKPVMHGEGCELIPRDIQHDINAKYSTDYFNDKELDLILSLLTSDQPTVEMGELYNKIELVKNKHDKLKKYFQK